MGTVVAQGIHIRAWRQKQWRLLSQHVRRLQPLASHLEAGRSASSHRFSTRLSPASLAALRYSICWPDVRAAAAICQGVEIVGELPSFGIYRKMQQPTPASHSCFSTLDNQRWLQDLLQGPLQEVRVVWEKSETERQLGILEGFYDPEDLHRRFGAYEWRPMIRFAIWQESHKAYRCIDNAKASEHNLCTSVEERIHTTSVDMGIAVCQRFRRLISQPLEGPLALHAATKDMKRAYRQVPVKCSHLRYSVIALWHPFQHKWVFGILHGLAFGLLSAVLQFNRFPALLVAIARRWLAIPVINFFDDFKITEPVFAKASGGLYFDKLANLLGWLFDPEKDKQFQTTAKFLHGLETYFPPEREGDVKNKLSRAIAIQKLEPKEARSLSGKLAHMAHFYLGRVGRGQIHAVFEQGLGKTAKVSPRLLRNLQFHLALIDLKPYRQVSLLPGRLNRRTVYTDASCEPAPPRILPVVQVSWLVLDTAAGVAEGGFAIVPDAVLHSFQQRSTYIAQGEAFGPLLAAHFHTDLLAQAHNIFFIENLGVLSALITGHARIADFGAVIHAFHLSMGQLHSTCWFEHIESLANPADGGS